MYHMIMAGWEEKAREKMPHKPASPCRNRSCPATTLHRSGYCEKHRPKRPSSASRGYDKAWQRIRDEYLTYHPLCERCRETATDVHHKRGIEAGHGWNNLEALCHKHHSEETAKKGGGFGNVRFG
jgi:5-methylcytosine-specific restriction protein A